MAAADQAAALDGEPPGSSGSTGAQTNPMRSPADAAGSGKVVTDSQRLLYIISSPDGHPEHTISVIGLAARPPVSNMSSRRRGAGVDVD